MRKSIVILLLVLLTGAAFGQTKLDLNLSRLAKQSTVAEAKGVGSANAKSQFVDVNAVLADGAEVPTAKLAALGIKVGFSGYGIVSMAVPVGSLSALNNLDEFKGFETPRVKEAMDSKSIEAEHADSLQDATKAKEEGLPQTYDGDGIVVGVFDYGIDFGHVNFRDPETGATRIKKAMLFRNYGFDKNYKLIDAEGNQIKETDIIEEYTDSRIDTLTTDNVKQSHGTNTAGIAAGSYDGEILNNAGVGYSNQHGLAYKADLVLAGARNLRDDFQALALAKMDTLAAQKPLVVNLSIGSNGGWMDGKTAMDVFYDNFTEKGEKPGRVICMSAGNEGYADFTIYKKLDADNNYTLKTFINFQEASPCIADVVNFYCSDETQLDVSLELLDATTTELIETYSCQDLIDKGFLITDNSAQHDNRFYGTFALNLDTPFSEFQKLPVLCIKSKDNHPCWVRMLQNNYSHSNIKLPFRSLSASWATAGDPASSLSEDACTNSILTVGAWSAQSTWTDFLGKSQTASDISETFPVGDVTMYSSFVESDDNGVARPDFVAPGEVVISGYNIYDRNNFNADGVYINQADSSLVGYAVDRPNRTLYSPYGMMCGTSMACPNAVGIIALWLQANPELTVNQIREVIAKTADGDSLPAIHKNRVGCGKINALQGLKYILQHYPTAIHEVVDGNPKGLDEPSALKELRNGRIVIVKGDKEYSISGQEMN